MHLAPTSLFAVLGLIASLGSTTASPLPSNQADFVESAAEKIHSLFAKGAPLENIETRFGRLYPAGQPRNEALERWSEVENVLHLSEHEVLTEEESINLIQYYHDGMLPRVPEAGERAPSPDAETDLSKHTSDERSPRFEPGMNMRHFETLHAAEYSPEQYDQLHAMYLQADNAHADITVYNLPMLTEDPEAWEWVTTNFYSVLLYLKGGDKASGLTPEALDELDERLAALRINHEEAAGTITSTSVYGDQIEKNK